MIVDTSALVAVLTGEPSRSELVQLMLDAEHLAISAATYLETAVVVDARRDPVLSRRLDALLEDLRVDVVAVSAEQARTARAAYRDFGKGTGHPARLNLGDCCSYALARDRAEPLLFVGDDFGHTDLRAAARE